MTDVGYTHAKSPLVAFLTIMQDLRSVYMYMYWEVEVFFSLASNVVYFLYLVSTFFFFIWCFHFSFASRFIPKYSALFSHVILFRIISEEQIIFYLLGWYEWILINLICLILYFLHRYNRVACITNHGSIVCKISWCFLFMPC